MSIIKDYIDNWQENMLFGFIVGLIVGIPTSIISNNNENYFFNVIGIDLLIFGFSFVCQVCRYGGLFVDFKKIKK